VVGDGTVRDLTLAQVKQAGRFAVEFDWQGYSSGVFVPGVGIVMIDGPETSPIIVTDEFPWRNSRLRWRHIFGCDCEFCHADLAQQWRRGELDPLRFVRVLFDDGSESVGLAHRLPPEVHPAMCQCKKCHEWREGK
jgi:hypothetical protein